jgi:hypothetical protein
MLEFNMGLCVSILVAVYISIFVGRRRSWSVTARVTAGRGVICLAVRAIRAVDAIGTGDAAHALRANIEIEAIGEIAPLRGFASLRGWSKGVGCHLGSVGHTARRWLGANQRGKKDD